MIKMSIVKITDKKSLDDLMARLTLHLGHRPSQQDVLDYCVKLAIRNFDELIVLLQDVPTVTKEKIERIKKKMDSHVGIPYDVNEQFPNPEDQDLLGKQV